MRSRSIMQSSFLGSHRTFIIEALFPFFAFVICVVNVMAQAPTGIQRFASYTDDLDHIDLATLVTHIDIPLYSVPGRGMYTARKLHAIYQTGYLDQADTNYAAANFGWRIEGGSGSSAAVFVTAGSETNCPPTHPANSNTFTNYTFYARDSTGLIHTFPGQTTESFCSGHSVTSLTVSAPDGSGYVLHASGGLASVTAPSGISSSGSGSADPNGNFGYSSLLTSLIVPNSTPNQGAYRSDSNGNWISRDPYDYTYTDPSGNSHTGVVAFSMQNVIVPPPPGDQETPTPELTGLLTSIALPDGTSYSFSYEPSPLSSSAVTGRLSAITLPTGGVIAYTYGGALSVCVPLTQLQRTTIDGIATYKTQVNGTDSYNCPASTTTTVSYPDGSKEVIGFVFTGITAGNNHFETSHQWYSTSGTLLRSRMRCYNGATGNCTSTPIAQPITQITTTTTLDDNNSSEVVQTYNTNSLVTETDEYGFGSASLYRKTVTAYASLGNNILDRPSSVIVYDGSNNIVKQTTFGYDESAIFTPSTMPSGGFPGSFSVSGSRGNMTSKHEWSSSTAHSDTSYTYDVTGRVHSVTDSNGNTTAHLYDSSTDTFLTQTAYPTVNGVTQVENFAVDLNTGFTTSFTDRNQVITQYTYSDPLLRMTKIAFAVGTSSEAWTTISYPNATTQVVATDEHSKGDGLLVSTTVTDGMRRPLHVTNAAGSTVDSTYDAMGRLKSTSNPHTAQSNTTDGVTSFAYDVLGRKTTQTQPDANLKQWQHTGPSVAYIDESGRTWTKTNDAFGRLIKVVEPTSAVTSYLYDTVGDLLTTTQAGLAGETPRTRSFTYDLVSRLLTAANPETGQICYGTWSGGSVGSGTCQNGYDGNGNLLAKTDARGITITYSYDALNRINYKRYSDSTSTAAFGYDGNNSSGATLPANYGASSNVIGRLTYASNSVNADEGFGYDPSGRVTTTSYCLSVNCGNKQNVAVTYNLAGDQTSITYPDGRIVQQGFDGADRMSSVTYQSWNGTGIYQPYFTVNTTNGYDPTGHMVNATFGNNVATSAGYDSRERLHNLAYGTSTAPLWGKNYSWAANGNLQDYIDQITGIQRQFSYDSLNRLTLAQDIVSTTAGTGTDNGGGGSSSGGGGAVGTSPGASGEVPWWTNPDESNILGDINAPNSGWTATRGVLSPDSVVAPDGTMTGATVTASSQSTDTYESGAVTSAVDYTGETMTGSAWLRSASGTMSIRLYLLETLQSGSTVALGSKSVQLTTAWQQFQVTGVVQNGISSLAWELGGDGSVQAPLSFYVWNPMLEDKGVAGSSVTNYAPFSQRFSTWSNNSQGTAADNKVAAPDGTTTAAILTASSGATNYEATDTLASPAPLSGLPLTGSVWLKVPSGSSSVLLTLYETNSTGGANLGAQTVTLTTTWQRFQITGTAESTLTSLVFQIGGNNSFVAGMVIDAWGAQLEVASTAGPYVVTADIPVTAATTLTNLTPFSQQLDGSTWGYVAASLTVNSDTAPDGATTAATVTGSSGSTDSYVTDAVANPALYDKQAVTASVYLRSTTGLGTISLYLMQNGGSGDDASITKTVTLNSTWQRFQLSGSLDNGLTSLLWKIGGGGSVKAGQSYEVWGAQVELNTKAGPYVSTSALPVLTGSEFINVLPNSQMFNSASWGQHQASVSTNADTAPDGTTTAAIVTGTTAATDVYIGDYTANPSLYDGETVTGSVYLRSTTSIPPFNIYLTDTGDNGFNISINQQVTLTSSWQRFELTGTLDNGLTQVVLQLGGGGTNTGTQSFEVWGPRLDIGSSPGPESTGPAAPNSGNTAVNVATGQTAALASYGLSEAYSYDSFGNLGQNGSFTSGFTANNQMVGYAYDAAGNLLSDGYNVMSWDAESRLSTDAGTTYVYDAEGQRVEKQGAGVTDTIYFGGRPVARYAGGQWTDLIYGPSGLLAEVPGTQTATPVYRLTDHLGNVVGNLLADGSYVNPLDYMPFGQVFSGSTSDPYMFTGKERDAESGLDYFGARYYSSNIGRFMSPDTPFTDQHSVDPQSWNLYTYVGNNPLGHIDPDGHRVRDTMVSSLIDAEPFWGGANQGAGANGSAEMQENEASYMSSVVEEPDPGNSGANEGGDPAQQQNGQPAQNPNGSVPKPADGKGPNWKPGDPLSPNEWVPGQGSGSPDGRPTRWGPKYPIPGGSQPGTSWDPDGHWDYDPGVKGGGRTRWLPDGGGPVDHDGNPMRSVLNWMGDHKKVIIGGAIVVGVGAAIILTGGAAAPAAVLLAVP